MCGVRKGEDFDSGGGGIKGASMLWARMIVQVVFHIRNSIRKRRSTSLFPGLDLAPRRRKECQVLRGSMHEFFVHTVEAPKLRGPPGALAAAATRSGPCRCVSLGIPGITPYVSS